MRKPPGQRDALSIGAILKLALAREGRGWRLGFATAGLMVHQACEVAVPILIGVVIDRAVMPADRGALVMWLAILGALFMVLSVSYQRASLAMVRVYGHGEHDLRQLAIGRVLHPRGGTDYRGAGEVLSITTSDTYRVAGVAWSIAQQGATIAAVLTTAGVLVFISAPLGLAVLAGAIAVVIGMQLLARPLERIGLDEQASVAAASEVATDATEGLRIVHGLGAQAEMTRRYRKASAASLAGSIAAARSVLAYSTVSAAVSTTFLGVLAFAAAVMASNGAITIGQLITVVGLAQFLQGSLAHLGTFGANWMHKRASAKRLHGLVAQDFALAAATDSAAAPRADTPALAWLPEHGPAVAVLHGQITGIRVESSASARRVARRLAYREPLAPGELLVGGRDAVELGPDAYRAAVTAPPHDATIFSGSLRENVAFADGELNARLVEATALDDVIDHLGGPDILLGEAGHQLSGGQRQRVLLARALHATAPVLVLDEPTTALDSATEQRIARGLRELSPTLIVVTSSPLLLAACDIVVDLESEVVAS